jgi:TatD DNase family protein
MEFGRHSGGAAACVEALRDLVEDNRDVVVAVGEMGLDYTEIDLCPKEVQMECFELQLEALAGLGLPLFLHSREVGMDFVEVLKRHRHRCVGVCVCVGGFVCVCVCIVNLYI